MPISRRPTAQRKPVQPQGAVAPALQERRRRLLQRHRLDAGLARPTQARVERAIPVPAAVTAALGGIGLFLGWLQTAWPLAAAGGVAVAAGGAWAVLRRPPASPVPLASAWDFDAARRLEQATQTAAGQLPAAALAALERLQATLARLAPALQAGPAELPFRADDALFIAELMRRYVPDSLEAYLRVPAPQRARPLAEAGASAEQLLVQQLDELAAQLAPRETRLAESAAGALLRQGEFLRVKRYD
jgi:hypothetical protein